MAYLKTPGQLAYEADCKGRPHYQDGLPRKPWEELSKLIQDTWEKNPTSRWSSSDE